MPEETLPRALELTPDELQKDIDAVIGILRLIPVPQIQVVLGFLQTLADTPEMLQLILSLFQKRGVAVKSHV